MPKYSILLFDADQTLLDFHRSEREAVRDCLCACKIEPSDNNIETYSRINAEFWRMLERGEIEKSRLFEERWRAFGAELGVNIDAAAVSKMYLESLSHKSYLIDGAYEMCERLAKKCRLYIITNGNKTVQTRRLEALGITELFDGIFISEDIGYEKPRIEFFDAVRRGISDFNDRDAIVIGDSLTSDIKGGINVGIDTCWYNPRALSAPSDMNITYIVRSFSEIERIVL